MANLKPIIEESFTNYAGAVLQSRALVDVRDCIKPSARQIFYCMETDKFTADKPFHKTLKAIGSAMRVYIHGDASCEGVIMRAGQPFSMRYPLVEVEGSYGNLMESANWAAPRYTSSRLSPIADKMFGDLKKNTIKVWHDNYDDTEQYPTVLPSKGYYNICNGTSGIGIGLSSSVPQFNIKEVNAALIKLLNNPDIADENLICMPDFATGAILLNPTEVKEALINGNGKSCKLRAVIKYDEKDNCLVVSEIPYSVYTNTICGELEAILESEENPGIERFNDLTGEEPLIKIYLVRGANVNAVLNYLYKNTSLQYWYGINFTMLDNGMTPRIFTWKEALQAHIDHEKEVYRRGYEYDKAQAEHRLHIVEGILIAIANIDEVVQTIKSSTSTSAASIALQQKFKLDEEQAKAILDIKLARLAHLEVEKYEQEKKELEETINKLTTLLTNEKLFNAQLIKGWQETAAKFGDERRTKIIEITEVTEDMPTKEVLNLVTTNGQLIVLEPQDKIQLNKKDSVYNKLTVVFGYKTLSTDVSYVFDRAGKMYKINNRLYDIGGIHSLNYENLVCGIGKLEKDYLITVSRKGIVKKTAIDEYSKYSRPVAAVKIREEDELVYVGCAQDSEYLYLLGTQNNLVKLSIKDLSATSRFTIGVKGIDTEVYSATIAADEQLVFTLANGKGKCSYGNDFSVTTRGGKGQVMPEGTTLIATFIEPIYIIEKSVKILQLTSSSCAIKHKGAVGAKITTEQFVKSLT